MQVADTLLDAAKVVGAEVCLELLVKPLEKLSQEVATGKAFEWRDAEAALYCIRSVSNSAPQPSNTLLAGLLAMLPTLPRHSQLLYTSCLTVSHYADWLSKAMQVCACACGAAGELLCGESGREPRRYPLRLVLHTA